MREKKLNILYASKVYIILSTYTSYSALYFRSKQHFLWFSLFIFGENYMEWKISLKLSLKWFLLKHCYSIIDVKTFDIILCTLIFLEKSYDLIIIVMVNDISPYTNELFKIMKIMFVFIIIFPDQPVWV